MSKVPRNEEDWPVLAPEGWGKPKVIREQHLEPRVVVIPIASGQSTPAMSRRSSLESADSFRMDTAEEAVSLGETSDDSAVKGPTKRNSKRRIESHEDETLTDSSVQSNNSLRSVSLRKSRKTERKAEAQIEVQTQWQLEEELNQQPLEEIEAKHRQKMVEVIRMANSAKHLKGTYVKALRESATYALAAMSASTKRIADRKEDAEKRALKLKVEVLQEKVEYLEKQLKKRYHANEEEPSLRQRLNRARQRSSSRSSGEEEGRRQKAKTAKANLSRRETEKSTAKQIEESVVRKVSEMMDTRFQQLMQMLQPNFKVGKEKERERKASSARPASEKRPANEKRPPSSEESSGKVPETKRKASKGDSTSRTEAAGPSYAQMVQRKREPAEKKRQQQQREDATPQLQQRSKKAERAGREEREKTDEWKTVGKKGKVVAKPTAKPQATKAPVERKTEQKKPASRETPKIGRVPRTAAVTLTMPEGGMSYLEAMKKAREELNMEELGIENVRVKRAATGGILMRIPGKEAKEKAQALSKKLETAFHGTGAKINAPMKMADLRVRGIVESVTQAEIANAIAVTGECRVDEVKVGLIRSTPRGLGTVWARCPLAAAKKLQRAKTIRVCWGPVPVEVLEKRQVQCFRCLEKGHVAANCPSAEDRSDQCFRCGARGHKSYECDYRPYCSPCAAKGKPSDHRSGAKACPGPTRKEKRANAKTLAVKRGPVLPAAQAGKPKPSGEVAERHEEAMEEEAAQDGQ